MRKIRAYSASAAASGVWGVAFLSRVISKHTTDTHGATELVFALFDLLGLILNTIVLYNTIYTQRALDHIATTTGSDPRGEDIERLSPLGSDHTTITGRYRVLLPQ